MRFAATALSVVAAAGLVLFEPASEAFAAPPDGPGEQGSASAGPQAAPDPVDGDSEGDDDSQGDDNSQGDGDATGTSSGGDGSGDGDSQRGASAGSGSSGDGDTAGTSPSSGSSGDDVTSATSATSSVSGSSGDGDTVGTSPGSGTSGSGDGDTSATSATSSVSGSSGDGGASGTNSGSVSVGGGGSDDADGDGATSGGFLEPRPTSVEGTATPAGDSPSEAGARGAHHDAGADAPPAVTFADAPRRGIMAFVLDVAAVVREALRAPDGHDAGDEAQMGDGDAGAAPPLPMDGHSPGGGMLDAGLASELGPMLDLAGLDGGIVAFASGFLGSGQWQPRALSSLLQPAAGTPPLAGGGMLSGFLAGLEP